MEIYENLWKIMNNLQEDIALYLILCEEGLADYMLWQEASLWMM